MALYLLDSSVLIALAVRHHISHPRAQAWFGEASSAASSTGSAFATCPITQGSLIRFLCREGAPINEAKAILGRVIAHAKHRFVPDDASYVDLDERGLSGHKQVTDFYLAMLARKHGAQLATLDGPLAALYPASCVRV